MEKLVFNLIYRTHLLAWKFGFKRVSYKMAIALIKYDNQKKLNMINRINLEGTLWESEK